MIKKGVSLLMALALCLTLLPASALAAEAQGQAGQEQTVLTQGNDGQTQAPGRDGAGEDDKTSDEAPDKAPDKAPDEEPDEAVSAVQALIDALPAAEDISDANADEVSGQLDAIDEAKLALTEEQATQLDFAKYDAAAAAALAGDTVPAYGARELRRTVSRAVEQALADRIAAGTAHPGTVYTADVDADGHIILTEDTLAACV